LTVGNDSSGLNVAVFGRAGARPIDERR
jgi:hypothetical protein